MAIDVTKPHGLSKYSAGTDPFPGRVGYNTLIDLINQIPGCGVGPLSGRPAPAEGLRFWIEEATGKLHVNTGTAWAGIADVGGVTPIAVGVGGSAAEGTSARAARADHKHIIPAATSTAPGAMPAGDKAKLDTATSAATANAIAQRDSGGRLSAAAPTSDAHLTPRAFVLAQISSAIGPLATKQPISLGASIDLNTLNYTEHFMQASSANAASGTNYPAPYAGDLAVVASTNGNFVWQYYITYGTGTRFYWRTYYNSGTTGTWSPWKELRANAASATEDGYMSKEDKKAFDEATHQPTPGSLAKRSSTGQLQVAEPVNSSSATTKAYVDELKIFSVIGANINLNDCLAPPLQERFYHQGYSSNTSLELNYPSTSAAGLLRTLANTSGNQYWQWWYAYGTNTNIYHRTYYNEVWGPWYKENQNYNMPSVGPTPVWDDIVQPDTYTLPAMTVRGVACRGGLLEVLDNKNNVIYQRLTLDTSTGTVMLLRRRIGTSWSEAW